MIKPVGDASKFASLKKRQTSSKDEKVLPHSTKTSLEDQVKLSPEALSALQIRTWVQEVKEMPDIREDKVTQAEIKLLQADYFELAAENISANIASLFFGGESGID